MRRMVLRNFRLLERPRLRECRHTNESTMWTNFIFVRLCLSSLHRSEFRTALISNTLKCSFPPVHRHEAATRHFHRRAGRLARSLWYLTTSSEPACRSKSSPFKLTSVVSLLTRRCSRWCPGDARVGLIGGR